ncbi:DUF302 domain-containing protein [uncultured Polaribacter sp.]|uniref:DUF302 domain-containing protein n=1 Tax=uncultured Polaribacter sp. TaxID=174711 RepID=UPI0026315482|nr:DUF302 domain-containing protein [uncultured Polaribacter sp.]
MKSIKWIILYSLILISCNTKKMNNGLIIKTSPFNVETTYTKLKTILENNPNLKILLQLNHSNNAASVDLKLNDTRIILFGNPKLGTPLMQENQTIGLDLPQKIIVYLGSDNATKIAYNSPLYLKERHNIQGNDAVLEKISNALNTITDKVISK